MIGGTPASQGFWLIQNDINRNLTETQYAPGLDIMTVMFNKSLKGQTS
jgi:hypothetical protein